MKKERGYSHGFRHGIAELIKTVTGYDGIMANSITSSITLNTDMESLLACGFNEDEAVELLVAIELGRRTI